MSEQVNQQAIFLHSSCLQVPVLTYLIIHCNLKCKPNKLFPLQVAYGHGVDPKKTKHTGSIIFNLRNQTLMFYR